MQLDASRRSCVPLAICTSPALPLLQALRAASGGCCWSGSGTSLSGNRAAWPPVTQDYGASRPSSHRSCTPLWTRARTQKKQRQRRRRRQCCCRWRRRWRLGQWIGLGRRGPRLRGSPAVRGPAAHLAADLTARMDCMHGLHARTSGLPEVQVYGGSIQGAVKPGGCCSCESTLRTRYFI